jgi:sugar lactone lactonase YvrE
VTPTSTSRPVRPRREVGVVSAESAYLGEGPRFDAQRGEVLWVDILAGVLRRSVLADGALRTVATYELRMPVGAAAPVAGGGGWLLAAGTGFQHLAEDGQVTLLAEAEPGRAKRVRMNDAVCDPRGRMLAGSVAWDEAPEAGTLFRFDADRSVSAVRRETTISNGLAWSHDGTTLWWSDSGVAEVRRFDYDLDTGTMDEGEAFLTFAPGEGVGDGLAIDDDGCLWVALWGGGCVRRYAPDGRLLEEVRLPVSNATAPCFVGSTLLVTTARKGLTPEQLAQEPLAGRVFAVDVGVGGPPVTPYRK